MIASSKTINLCVDNTQTSVHHPEESICYSYDLTNKKINFLLKGFKRVWLYFHWSLLSRQRSISLLYGCVVHVFTYYLFDCRTLVPYNKHKQILFFSVVLYWTFTYSYYTYTFSILIWTEKKEQTKCWKASYILI